MARDGKIQPLARQVFDRRCQFSYSYHFAWLRRPIIPYPADRLALREIIWNTFPQRLWSQDNNPQAAGQEFLRTHHRVRVDERGQNKSPLTVAPSGYLRCIAG